MQLLHKCSYWCILLCDFIKSNNRSIVKYPFLTPEFLHEQYVVLGKSCIQIQQEFGVQAYGTIEHYVRKYCLRRPRKQLEPLRKDLTKELIEEELFVNKLTMSEIALKYHSTRGVVRHRMKKYNIVIEHKRQLITEEKLRFLYLEEKRSCWEIAKIFDTQRNFISKQLKKYNIETRGNTGKCWKDVTDDIEYIGYKDISGSYWRGIKKGAKERNLEMEINIKYAWDIWEKQQGLCAISGEKLILLNTMKISPTQTASLDRIDSKKGYIEGNIQWTHKYINRFKSNLSMTDFLAFVKKIADYNKLCS